MKKILSYIITIFFVVIVMPSVVVFVFSEKKVTEKKEVKEEGKEITIQVKTDKGIKSFDIESYLFGVVAAEMPASFEEEALKAQAVASRTYIINKTFTTDSSHPDADVCTDSTHCCAYLSDSQISEKLGADWNKNFGDKIRDAISATKNEILVYNGEPIQAVFHSTSNGKTENAVSVWGKEVPYLESADSPGDTFSPKYNADITVSKIIVAEKVKGKRNIDVEVYTGDLKYNDSGSVAEINIGGEMFTGVEVREMFNLPSATFIVENSVDNLIFHTKGNGHGVGMSQYGAEYYAENGMKYQEILKIYYKGTELEKYGEDNDKGNKN